MAHQITNGSSENAVRAALERYNLKLPADREGREKLLKALGHYVGDEGRALCAMVAALLEETR